MRKLRLSSGRKLPQGDNKWQNWPAQVLPMLKASECSPLPHKCSPPPRPPVKDCQSHHDQIKCYLQSLLPRQNECIYLGMFILVSTKHYRITYDTNIKVNIWRNQETEKQRQENNKSRSVVSLSKCTLWKTGEGVKILQATEWAKQRVKQDSQRELDENTDCSGNPWRWHSNMKLPGIEAVWVFSSHLSFVLFPPSTHDENKWQKDQ